MTIKYTERAIPIRGAYFGEGSGPIHLSRAECRNDDTRLINCTIDKTGINGCVHSEDAGMICMGKICKWCIHSLFTKEQVPATVKILMSSWLAERVREKDEWRFVTMEYGGQCVTMAGIKWLLMSSADSWVSTTKELCPSTIVVLEMEKVQYYWKMSDVIKSIQTYLSV